MQEVREWEPIAMTAESGDESSFPVLVQLAREVTEPPARFRVEQGPRRAANAPQPADLD